VWAGLSTPFRRKAAVLTKNTPTPLKVATKYSTKERRSLLASRGMTKNELARTVLGVIDSVVGLKYGPAQDGTSRVWFDPLLEVTALGL
jgi:hypothetical protein